METWKLENENIKIWKWKWKVETGKMETWKLENVNIKIWKWKWKVETGNLEAWKYRVRPIIFSHTFFQAKIVDRHTDQRCLKQGSFPKLAYQNSTCLPYYLLILFKDLLTTFFLMPCCSFFSIFAISAFCFSSSFFKWALRASTDPKNPVTANCFTSISWSSSSIVDTGRLIGFL